MGAFARRARAAALAAALCCAASAAWAHALLVAAAPEHGAVLAAAPAEATLRFNETVAPVMVRLIDAAGRAVAAATPPAGETIALPLPADLASGSYVISWRVVSADAHPVGGALVFTVGAPGPLPALPEGAGAGEAGWRIAAIVVRSLRDAALAFAAGGVLFVALVLAPGDALAARLARPLRVAAALAAALSLAAVGIVGGLATEAPALLDLAAWRFGLATTAAPAAAAVALGAATMAAALPARTPAGRVLAVLGALVATAGPALTGHAAVGGPALQLLLALHVLAASFWLGALWPLLALVRRGDDEATARAARRFAILAGAAVALLVAAGAALALAHAGTVAALAASTYGALIAVKLGLLAALLAIAAANRWRLAPRLARDRTARRALAATLRLDLALGALAIAAAALLAHTPPPHDPARHDHPHDPGEARGVAVAAASGTRLVVVEVDPGRAGANTVTLAFRTAEAPFAPREVRVELSLPAAGIEAIARPALPAGDGRYRFAGPELAVAGEWHLRIEALVSDFEKVVFEARIAIR